MHFIPFVLYYITLRRGMRVNTEIEHFGMSHKYGARAQNDFVICIFVTGSRLRPKTLQAVDVPVIASRDCEGWHKGKGINVIIYDEMMCAGYREVIKHMPNKKRNNIIDYLRLQKYFKR